LATKNGHESIIKLLLEAGAKVEAKDDNGRTPLLLAAENGHEAVVKLLLEAKANVESKDNYPIWWPGGPFFCPRPDRLLFS
jgi:ankyrin repeat protein